MNFLIEVIVIMLIMTSIGIYLMTQSEKRSKELEQTKKYYYSKAIKDLINYTNKFMQDKYPMLQVYNNSQDYYKKYPEDYYAKYSLNDLRNVSEIINFIINTISNFVEYNNTNYGFEYLGFQIEEPLNMYILIQNKKLADEIIDLYNIKSKK